MSESTRQMLAREAVEAEARAEAEERGDVPPARGQRGRRPATDPSQVYAVRIPVSRLRELRQVADRMGEPPSSLIRRWVLTQLDAVRSPATVTSPEAAEAVPGGRPLHSAEVRLGRRRCLDDAYRTAPSRVGA